MGVGTAFTASELKLLDSLVEGYQKNLRLARIPLQGSALSPEVLVPLSEENSKRLLTTFSIRSKIDLLNKSLED